MPRSRPVHVKEHERCRYSGQNSNDQIDGTKWRWCTMRDLANSTDDAKAGAAASCYPGSGNDANHNGLLLVVSDFCRRAKEHESETSARRNIRARIGSEGLIFARRDVVR